VRKRTLQKGVPHQNRSPHGWWIASYLERFEYYDDKRDNPNRRCLAWENTILVKARNRDQAWRKAIAKGREGEGSEAWDAATGRKGAWHFEGLTSLLPVYEELEDGAEILWREHAGRTVRTIRSLVKKRAELEAFDDREQK
jgi:uncharacterized protein DUF4288